MPFSTFKDLDKSITDLFNDDFDTKYSLKVKTAGPSDSTFTTNTQFDLGKENKLVPKVTLKWPHNSGFTLEKLEVASNGALTTETSLSGLVPGLKLEFKGNDSNKGDLSATYTHVSATVTAEVDALNFAKASASLSSGQGPFTYGASAEVNVAKSSLGPVTVGLGYALPNLKLFLKSSKTFTEHSALLSYTASPDITLAAQATHAASLQASVAGVYKCNPDTIIKLKATSAGVVSASVKQSFEKKFSLVGAVEVPSTLNSAKFGLAASLG